MDAPNTYMYTLLQLSFEMIFMFIIINTARFSIAIFNFLIDKFLSLMYILSMKIDRNIIDCWVDFWPLLNDYYKWIKSKILHEKAKTSIPTRFSVEPKMVKKKFHSIKIQKPKKKKIGLKSIASGQHLVFVWLVNCESVSRQNKWSAPAL